MRALKGALGFFSTVPLGRDEESFEALRRNLWILPVVGTLLGVLIAVPTYLLGNFAILGVLIYIALEGINHIDGLADFGDALFAPKDRKLRALKDLNVGVGGTVTVSIYIFILMWSFAKICKEPLAIVDSQMMAKLGMLLMLTTTKPLWDGMGAYMMEHAKVRDLIIGGCFSVLVTISIYKVRPEVLAANILTFCICLAYRCYVMKTFGGVNGDIIGAMNCIAFISCLISFLAFRQLP